MPKISELTALTFLEGDDSIPIVDDTDDTTKYTTMTYIVDYTSFNFTSSPAYQTEFNIGVNNAVNEIFKQKTFDLTSGSLTTDYTDTPAFTISAITNADSSKTVTLQNTLGFGIHTFINESSTDTVDIVLPVGSTFVEDGTTSKTIPANDVLVISYIIASKYTAMN